MKPTNKKHNIPLSVGYSITDENQPLFCETVERFKDNIGEVYFAFTGIPSGRSALGGDLSFFDTTEQLIFELDKISKMGIKLNLLFNAACLGDEALSKAHEKQVISVLQFLGDRVKLPDTVTTMSPVTAQIVHKFDSKIDVRASVNMKISTVKGIEYVEHLFDSFCIFRDINRNLEELKEVSDYLRKNSKGISILANSGCLRGCSMQSFHDNVVAHEEGILKQNNLSYASASGCHEFFSNKENHFKLLQNTWIRPEDLHNYEGFVDMVKLATRAHDRPEAVIGAYARGSYHSNLVDLFEPSHTQLLNPTVVANDLFPDDFFVKTAKCNKKCNTCNYCKNVWDKVAVKIEE